MKMLYLGAFLATVSLSVMAQATNAAPASTTGATATAATDDRREKFKEAFAQLNLSDDQKQKMEQIRASTSPGKERRQQMMAVLTPEQKEKLKQQFATWRQTHEAGTTAAQ